MIEVSLLCFGGLRGRFLRDWEGILLVLRMEGFLVSIIWVFGDLGS